MSEVKIKDGTGNSISAKVDAEYRLHTRSTTESENHYVNTNKEEAYLYYSDITPTGAGSICCYVKNTSDKDLVLNWYRIWSGTTAEAIDIYIGSTGTPASTTTIIPSNMNITSKNSAEGSFFEGVGITGLSGGTLLDRLRLSGDGNDVLGEYPGDIILQKGGVMTLQALTGAIALEITLSFYYRKKD
jgi:hypothetical protein